MEYKNYNKLNEDKLIVLANSLINYAPTKVRKDKYYGMISRSLIKELCCKNKSVLYAIRNKSKLCLEDYGELLNAIGYILFDYCKARLTEFCNKVIEKYGDYSFSVSKDMLIEMALGRHDGNGIKWSLKSGNGVIKIIKYRLNKNSELIMCRGENDSYNVSEARVIQIGLLKMFISDAVKKIYCVSTADEYLLVRKTSDNIYTVCERTA